MTMTYGADDIPTDTTDRRVRYDRVRRRAQSEWALTGATDTAITPQRPRLFFSLATFKYDDDDDVDNCDDDDDNLKAL
jgi:hypothetical protein